MPIPLKQYNRGSDPYRIRKSSTVNEYTHTRSTERIDKCSKTVTTFVEVVTENVQNFAETADMPESKDYQLEQMLKAGIVPQEVNCSGMLDSDDPLDLSNAGVVDSLLDGLSPYEKSEPTSDPSPDPTPSSTLDPTPEPTANE